MIWCHTSACVMWTLLSKFRHCSRHLQWTDCEESSNDDGRSWSICTNGWIIYLSAQVQGSTTNWQLFRNPFANPCYFQEITRIGVDFLRHLGLSMPYEASTDDVEAEVDKINTLLANKPISSLIDSPFVTDQKACYLITSPNMFSSVSCKLLTLLFFFWTGKTNNGVTTGDFGCLFFCHQKLNTFGLIHFGLLLLPTSGCCCKATLNMKLKSSLSVIFVFTCNTLT